MKRLFVAVDLSPAVLERLAKLQETLAERLDDGVRVKWTDPDKIHLTLKFLGDTEERLLPAICDKLAGVAGRAECLEIASKGLGCFPRPDNPRVLWAGFDADSAAALRDLQQPIDGELADLGIPRESRAYVPHVTLGRIKSPEKPSMNELFAGLRSTDLGSSDITELVLYESTLDHTGATYETIDHFTLASQ